MINILPLRMEYCETTAAIAGESLPEGWSLKEIQNVLRKGCYCFFVASDAPPGTDLSAVPGCIIGFAGMLLVGGEAELLSIAVTGSRRRQGIASLLLDRLFSEMEERGIRRMLLEVREGNLAAQALYARYGFRRLAVRKGYYRNPVEDAVVMEWIFVDTMEEA